MKCSCGAENPDGAKFCGKCGKKVVVSSNKHCEVCGALLYPGAKFCGKCSAPVIMTKGTESAKCHTCGADLYPGARFCGKCSAPVTVTTPNVFAKCRTCGATLYPGMRFCEKCRTPISANPLKPTAGNIISILREKARPARDWADSKIINKDRAKKLLIIALIVGLCFIFTGFAGKNIMGQVSSTLNNAGFFEGLGNDLDGLLNRSAGNIMNKILVSLIKNDYSGFNNAIKQVTNTVSSVVKETSGVFAVLGLVEEPMFSQLRTELIQEVGAYWPLFQIIAYHHEFLTIGFIIAIAAFILWFLLDGKLRDIKELKLKPILYIGAGWIALTVFVQIYCLSRFNQIN